MDAATLQQVSHALDRAIAYSAGERLNVLGSQIDRQQSAERIVRALRALERLGSGGKPEYDEWVAIFYALWYQPGQINLAYTLARSLLEETRDGEPALRLDDSWHLHVNDFGCGTWAMQFGLALALADLKHPSQGYPTVTVNPEDESLHMKAMGDMMWRQFLSVVQDDVAQACRAVTKGSPAIDKGSRRETWLTALHAFYEEGHDERMEAFQNRVDSMAPDIILATTQKSSARYLPPRPNGYRGDAIFWGLTIPQGTPFFEVDELRPRIFAESVHGSRLSGEDKDFAEGYLTPPVKWQSNAVIRCERRCYRSEPDDGHA